MPDSLHRADLPPAPSAILTKAFRALLRARNPARSVSLSAEAAAEILTLRDTDQGWLDHAGRQIMFDLRAQRAWT